MIDYLHGVALTPLRRLLFTGALAGGKEVEDTATGNPLTFLTDLARPLKELLVSWTPTQSGSGDPSPENVRPISGMSGVTAWHTGENLFDEAHATIYNRYISINSASSASWIYSADSCSFAIEVKPNTRYSIQAFNTEATIFRICAINVDPSTVGSTTVSSTNAVQASTLLKGQITTRSDERWIVIQINSAIGTSRTGKIMVSVGDYHATTYTPYVGESYPVTFPATGKNLLDINVFSRNGITASKVDGKAVLSGTAQGSAYSVELVRQTLSAGTYTASISGLETGMECVITKDGAWYRSVTSATTFTLTGDALIGGYVRTADGTEIDTTVSIMLEQGSSASTFEPYTSTIYGGSLDLVTGVLTAEYGIVDMGTLNYVLYGETSTRQTWQFALDAEYPTDGSKPLQAISSKFKQVNRTSVWSPNTMSWTSTGSFNYGIVNFEPGAYESGNAVKTAMEGTQLCYLLKTPLTYQLTPQQITALIGDNTIWADANGDCEVTYLKKG